MLTFCSSFQQDYIYIYQNKGHDITIFTLKDLTDNSGLSLSTYNTNVIKSSGILSYLNVEVRTKSFVSDQDSNRCLYGTSVSEMTLLKGDGHVKSSTNYQKYRGNTKIQEYIGESCKTKGIQRRPKNIGIYRNIFTNVGKKINLPLPPLDTKTLIFINMMEPSSNKSYEGSHGEFSAISAL